MKKFIIKLIYGIVILFFVIFYFLSTFPPYYDARLTLEIDNRTWNSIEGAYISYENSDIKVEIPQINPFEKIIILPQYNDVDTLKTKVYITYNNEKHLLIEEYRKQAQYSARVIYTFKGLKCIDDSYGGIPLLRELRIKPYFRVFDLDGTDWDGHPPLRKSIIGF